MADPYSTLGVARGASEAEIKKAYRTLAKELHPDRNKDNPKAAERFSQVTQAYDLLTDKDKRARFDRGEIDGDGNPSAPFGYGQRGPGGGFAGHGPGGGSFDFGGEKVDVSDLFSDLFGGGRSEQQRGGFGFGRRPQPKGANIAYRLSVPFADAATLKTQRITLADGKTIDLKLPPGVEDGTQMRLTGKGQIGAGGAGDGIVTIAVEPHKFFTRTGDDIRLDLPISLAEAVLGASVRVPTVDGAVMLTIPKGSSSGKTLRLKGKGFTRKDGQRGDQFVTLMVDLPVDDDALVEFVQGWPGKNGNPRGISAFDRLMQDISPQSPEERRKRLDYARRHVDKQIARIRPGTYPFEVAKRVVVGVYNDGFVHAGNLAYLAILTLFPFFIVAAAIARLFGQSEESLHTVEAFLRTVPPSVADVLQKPIIDVLSARSGSLLWFGALVGLWTTASFIETIRDILRRAYGVKFTRPFWEYRLGSIGLIIGSVILVLIAFSFQVVLVAVEQFIVRVLPFASDTASLISALRVAPGVALFAAMYIMFYSLTPRQYRDRKCPKWPGAAATTIWWLGVTALLPIALSYLVSYDLTYGSLAGVMITLIFFFFVGLGVVLGAELNAALAETPEAGLEEDSKSTDDQGVSA